MASGTSSKKKKIRFELQFFKTFKFAAILAHHSFLVFPRKIFGNKEAVK